MSSIITTSSASHDGEMIDYDNIRQVNAQLSSEACINAVEKILDYKFKNRKLLEDALTHPSYSGAASNQRLEFIGDAALGLALANFVFLAYPTLGPGQLSLLRAANVSTEKLARIAVRHGLYRFVRHNALTLDEKVREFAQAVQDEERTAVYGGVMKAPKVLADTVEAIAAAVYVDCEFDLKALWLVFGGMLEPIVTLEALMEQPQPVTMLFELCQKQGKRVDIKHWRKESSSIAQIYVDGKLIASGVSDQKESSKLNAAREALGRLAQFNGIAVDQLTETFFEVNEDKEIENAKQKLHEVSSKMKWSKPSYRVENEVGPAHNRRFISSVQVETAQAVLIMSGNEKRKVKDAENSAASRMIYSLVEAKYIEASSSLQPQLPL